MVAPQTCSVQSVQEVFRIRLPESDIQGLADSRRAQQHGRAEELVGGFLLEAIS